MDEDVRRELDLLHQADRDLRQAIADLDNHGSRGVLALQSQVTDLIKDMAEIKVAIGAHETQHENEARERRNGRRWMVGAVFTGMSGFAAVIAILIDVLRHLH